MKNEGDYHKISILIERILEMHKGETFDLDMVCRWADIKTASHRDYVTQVLSHHVRKTRKLEKNNRLYRYIDNNYSYIDIINSDPNNTIQLSWPKDEQGNDFNLRFAKIYPKSTITLAGEKDNAKTCFCLNFIAENMDNHHCVYHTNEMSGEELKGRMNNFTWVDWYKEDGTCKFLAVEMFEHWYDLVRDYPDSVHVIDYIDPGSASYEIGGIIDKIRRNLNKVALISIQKKQSSYTKKDGTVGRNFIDYGIGGQYSEHRARMVIHLHKGNELYVKSCKAWEIKNPAGRMYKFNITNHGSRFANIKEIITDENDLPF